MKFSIKDFCIVSEWASVFCLSFPIFYLHLGSISQRKFILLSDPFKYRLEIKCKTFSYRLEYIYLEGKIIRRSRFTYMQAPWFSRLLCSE